MDVIYHGDSPVEFTHDEVRGLVVSPGESVSLPDHIAEGLIARGDFSPASDADSLSKDDA